MKRRILSVISLLVVAVMAMALLAACTTRATTIMVDEKFIGKYEYGDAIILIADNYILIEGEEINGMYGGYSYDHTDIGVAPIFTYKTITYFGNERSYLEKSENRLLGKTQYTLYINGWDFDIEKLTRI